MIRDVEQRDVGRICEIYNHYVRNTSITFDIDPLEVEEMREKITAITDASYPYIVFESENQDVIGYAYCSKFRGRSAYKETVEISVYVDNNALRIGIGRKLLNALLAGLRDDGYHTALSVISLPNEPSEALHQNMGFEKVGTIKEAGFKGGTYIDIAFWQLMLQQG